VRLRSSFITSEVGSGLFSGHICAGFFAFSLFILHCDPFPEVVTAPAGAMRQLAHAVGLTQRVRCTNCGGDQIVEEGFCVRCSPCLPKWCLADCQSVARKAHLLLAGTLLMYRFIRAHLLVWHSQVRKFGFV
jgi:hypothetical protein